MLYLNSNLNSNNGYRIITHLCDCNKCGEWRHTKVCGGAIVRRQKQWDANPRFYVCEQIDGNLHTEVTYMHPNKNNMLPEQGYIVVVSPNSTVNDPEPSMRPS
jgi:hypothetical protein